MYMYRLWEYFLLVPTPVGDQRGSQQDEVHWVSENICILRVRTHTFVQYGTDHM